jgi:hypothetical protein
LLEPALVGAMIAINLGQTSLQNLYLKTACTVDLGKDINICSRGVGEDFRVAEVTTSQQCLIRQQIGTFLSYLIIIGMK